MRSGRKPDALREQAEKQLSKRKTIMRQQDAQKVLHELEVHQVELQMQNEALRQAQDTLMASQEKYTDLYDFAPVGYFTFNSKGLISDVNLTGASLLGVARGQLRSKPFSLFVAAPSRDTFHRHYKGILKTGAAGACELQMTKKDGTSFYASVQSSPVRNPDGNLTCVRSAIADITERKQAEEEFKKESREQEQLKAQLRQAQKMEAIGTLAGGIAHDFNNILAAMIGFSELAIDDIPAGSKAQRHLKMVLEAGLRGRELVKQILTFSRDSDRERKQVSLRSLVYETHALLRASLPTTIQMPLAITTSNDYVLANPTQIQQVLMNLATNAAQAMREEGGQLTVGLTSVAFPRGSLLPDPNMEPGSYVKLTMKDTGAGMTEEVTQRIFEPFFTTKAPGKGTGMGLATVYGIVKSHGGAVTVQSELGRGSIFSVYLPQVQEPEVSKEEEATFALPTGTERVLFVDDEEVLVEMGRDILERLGYHVTVAKHPTDAWNLFLEDPSQFDLVITDQTMPGLTGVTLAKKMLRVREEMPIILCTGYSEMASADKARKAGICEFIMKPMLKKELAETIRRALDGGKD